MPSASTPRLKQKRGGGDVESHQPAATAAEAAAGEEAMEAEGASALVALTILLDQWMTCH